MKKETKNNNIRLNYKNHILDKSKTIEKDKINNNTPWNKLPIKIDLKRYLTRHILVEKYCPIKGKVSEMTDFFISKLHDCELFTHDDYPDWVFFIKKSGNENTVLFEKNDKNKVFHIRYSTIWSVFETKYGLEYAEIQSFTQHKLEDLLNCKGYKTILWALKTKSIAGRPPKL